MPDDAPLIAVPGVAATTTEQADIAAWDAEFANPLAALPAQRVSPETVDYRTPAQWGPWQLRLTALGIVTVTAAALWVAQALLWRHTTNASDLSRVFSALSWLWTLAFFAGGISVAGMLLHRRRDTRPVAVANLVSFRYVSRGQNVDTLRAAVASVRLAMQGKPLFPYLIELVLEQPVDFGDAADLRTLVVPPDYRTANGTLFKARGLQFAVENSTLPADAWILHLDEESHVTPSVVVGVAAAVDEEERSGRHRIGQGAVLYHHTLTDHPVLTLADNIRTGDDLGRWHLQNAHIGMPLLGMHGSFVLARQSLEVALGFDYGPQSSVTEDAWWALVATATGHRTRWVDGVIVEQAPEQVSDFVKQRRRWMSGLVKVARHADVPFRYRAPLMAFLGCWALGPVALLSVVANFAIGAQPPSAVRLIADVTFGCYLAIYLVGLRTNLRDVTVSRRRKALLYVGQVVLLPFFSLLEVAGSAWGVVRPNVAFHVIKKRH